MIVLALILLGLCLGSFTNAFVWRLHEQNKPKSKRAASDQELSIVSGHSMCTHCKHRLQWYDLIPVISWLTLMGRCRYCRKPISIQYPVVELLTASLFVLSYLNWPASFRLLSTGLLFGLWLAFIVGFMVLGVYDLRWMILPNRIVFPLQFFAVVFVLIRALGASNWVGVVGSAFIGVACSAGLFYAIFQLSDGKWIGGGDVKLAVVLGLLVGGPMASFLMLFVASLLGSIVGLPLLLWGKSKRNTKLPFGPFLITATIIVFLFGASLMNWYKKQFLFL